MSDMQRSEAGPKCDLCGLGADYLHDDGALRCMACESRRGTGAYDAECSDPTCEVCR